MEKHAFESHLGELGGLLRTLRFRERFYLVLGALFGFCLLLILADWRFQFGPSVRFTLDLILVAILLWGAVWVLKSTFRRLRPEYLAVMAEGGNAAMDNVLVSAVQFRELVHGGDPLQGVSRPMVDEEFRLADQLAETVNLRANIDRARLRRSRNRFLAALAVCGLGFWFAWDAAHAILPRYLDPWGDHPPYSRTHLELDPRVTTVDYGDDVTIGVRAEGEKPRDIRLMVRSPDGEWKQIPLFLRGEEEYEGTIKGIEEPLEVRAEAHRTRSPLGRVDVDLTPRFREVLVRYRYPAYTRMEDRTERLRDSGISAIRKTRVTLEVESNRPLDGGTLSLKPEGAERARDVVMSASGARWVRGEFLLEESGAFEVSLRDVAGNRSAEPLSATMEALPDLAPEVVITEPEPYSLATPDIEIPVLVDAQDDFGVTAVELFTSVRGSPLPPKRWEPETDPPGELASAEFEVVPGDMGAQPGDTVDIFARAWDNDPDGEKAGRSAVHTLRIISEEEYRRFLKDMMTANDLREKYSKFTEEMRSLLEKQREIRERTEEAARELERPSLLPEEQERLDRLAEDLANQERELAERAQELADRMGEQAGNEPVLDIEKEFNDLLREQAEELARLAAQPMPQAADSLAKSATGETGKPGESGEQGETGESGESGQSGQSGESGESAESGRSGQSGGKSSGMPSLTLPNANQSLEKQREAEESLEKMLGQNEQEIAQNLQRIEDVMRVYQDLMRLYQLYQSQKQVTAEAAPYGETEQAEGRELRGLRQISPEQERIWKESLEVQEDLCEHAEAFVGDASFESVIPKIQAVASALDDLYIVPNAGSGSLQMARGKGNSGAERAAAAQEGFRLLFDGKCGECQGSGSCESLCMGLGQCMGTGGLPKPGSMPGMGSGMGSGFGQGMGGTGMGAGGNLGSAISQLAMNMNNNAMQPAQSSMNIYGPDTPQGTEPSTITGHRKKEADHLAKVGESPFALSQREVMKIEKRERVKYLPGGAERSPEEYKRLVDEYFRVIAEEGK